MATDLTKPVTRRTYVTIRHGGVEKRLVVTMYPSGDIGVRPEGTRSEERYPIAAIYSLAVKARVRSK